MSTESQRHRSLTWRHDDRPPRPTRFLLVVASVVTMAVGLAAGLAIGRGSDAPGPTSPPGLAEEDVLAMLEDRVQALNEGTEEELAAFYSRDAVLEEQDMGPPATVTRGGAEIAAHLFGYRSMGFRLDPETTAIQLGRYVAEGLRWGSGGGIVVYELDTEGRIAHSWVIGGTP